MFFTPPALSERLIEDLEDNGANFEHGLFMDPACGGAAFLAPVALRMRALLQKKGFKSAAILEHISENVIGVDVDPTLCNLSSFFLRMALYDDIVAARKEPKFNVKMANALSSLKVMLGKVDVILCNPPYRKMPADEVAQYRKRFGEVIKGQPNLYGLFFAQALGLLRAGGIAGFLTPTSFLSGQYFSKLRTHLLTRAEVVQIDIVSDRTSVFVGVEQKIAISILKKRLPQITIPRRTKVFALVHTNSFVSLGTYVLPNSGLAWPVPRTSEDAETTHVANGSPFRLIDYGYVPRIGAFVWNRDKRGKYYNSKTALKAKAPFPLIWSSDISQDGTFIFNRHKDGKHHAYVDIGIANSTAVIRRPCVVLQRVTSNDQPRRLVAAPIHREFLDLYGGVVGENHVVFLEQITERSALTPAQLAEILRSNSLDRLFRCISGATNVSAFELLQLPMPEPCILARELTRTNNPDAAVLRAFQHRKGVSPAHFKSDREIRSKVKNKSATHWSRRTGKG